MNKENGINMEYCKRVNALQNVQVLYILVLCGEISGMLG